MSSLPVRTVFAIPNMETIGAQRVVSFLLRGLDRSKVEPVLLVHRKTGAFLKDIPKDVAIHEIHSSVDSFIPPILRFITYAAGYHAALTEIRPRVVIGVSEYPSMMLAHVRRVKRHTFALIAQEHCFMSRAILDPSAFDLSFRLYFERRFPAAFNDQCRFVTVLTQEAADDLVSRWGIRRELIRTIPNPIDTDFVVQASRAPVHHPWLRAGRRVAMGIGRLVVQKRFDRLIDAFAKVRDKDASLLLIGHGPLESALRRRAAACGLGKRFDIIHETPPYASLAKASVLALTSQWEGFGMVILEAMALGVPVVSVACPAGPRDLLKDGVLGGLVPEDDPPALTAALNRALEAGPELRREVSAASLHSHTFSLPTICKQYEAVILEAATDRI